MKSKELKSKVKKHLWAWGYSVRDIEEILPGENCNFDLVVRTEKDSKIAYRVKVVSEKEAKEELELLKEKRGYNVLAIVGKNIKYAGGNQKEIMPANQKEVFK